MLTIIASILLAVALITAGGAALVLSQRGGASSSPGAQTSYSSTTTSTASATTTPNVNIIFQDNFSSNTSGWPNDSHCFYGSGGYHVLDGYNCYAPTGLIADIVVSADIQQVAGETRWFYGVVLRRVSKGNFYAMYIDGNGEWKFSKFVNGQRTDLIPYVHTNAINTGLNTNNNLTVRAQGTHFVFLVNNVEVGHFDDATFDKGWCGLAGNSQGQVEIVASKFTVGLPN